MQRRLVSTAVLEWRLERRAGIPAIVLALAGAWLVVSSMVPDPWQSTTVTLGLFVDLSGVGLLVVPALVVGERASGTDRMLQFTNQPRVERVLVRVAVSTAIGAVGAAVLVTGSGVDGVPGRMAGIVSMASFFALASWTVLGRGRTLTVYMTRLPLVAVPLIVPALLHHLDLWQSPLAWMSPVTGQLTLLSGERIGLGGWTGQAVWWAVAVAAAARAVSESPERPPADPHTRTGRRPPGPGPLRRLRSLLWVDRSVLLGDPLALMVILGVPATALVSRLVTTVGSEWVSARVGVAIEGAAPLMVGLLVVVHTPVLVGSVAGLLLLEDHDAGMWPLVATTRFSFRGLVAYRCALAAVVAAVLTAVGLLVAGAGHGVGAAGFAVTVLAAGAVAPVPTLLMAALSRDRTAGVGVMKLMGVPFYLPLALWWIEGPWELPFALVPTTWPLTTLWAETLPGAVAAAGASGVAASVAGALLWRRLDRRIT